MTTNNPMAGAAGRAAALPVEQREPHFQPFAWSGSQPAGTRTVPAYPAAELAAMTRDIAAGVRTVLQMLEQDDMAADCTGTDVRPLLSPVARGNLLRLAMASLQSLDEQAMRLCDRIGDADASEGGES